MRDEDELRLHDDFIYCLFCFEMVADLTVAAFCRVHEDAVVVVEHQDGRWSTICGGFHRLCSQEEELGLVLVLPVTAPCLC